MAQAYEAAKVEIRGTRPPKIHFHRLARDDEDWRTEYLDLVLSIRVVDSLDQAIDHINRYGSGHSIPL